MTATIRPAAAAAAAATLVLAGPLSAQGFADRETLRTLDGIYASPAPEPWYGGFGTREFTFGDGRWDLVFTHALDPAMEVGTFQFVTGGPYEVGPAVHPIPGAFEGDFHEAFKKVRLLTDDAELIAALGLAECGLVPGEMVDISATGCANWKSVAECGTDHDLFAMDAEGVYFGVRPADNDMCTPDRRPAALLTPVVAQ